MTSWLPTYWEDVESNPDLRPPDLSAAVDVYSEWIDACDQVAKEAAGKETGARTFAASGSAARRGSEEDEDMNEELGIVDDDDDGEGDYDD